MAAVYQPWPQRPAKRFSGFSAGIADMALALYRATAPLVQRFAAGILAAATIAACLLAWAVALLFRAVADVQGHAGWGQSGGASWLTLDAVRDGLAKSGWSLPAPLVWLFQSLLLRDVVGITAVIGFVSVLAMYAIWWERKVAGHIQSRLGPMRVGGWHGWSQSLADGVKLIAKEDLVPDKADRLLFRLAPYLSFVPALLAFVSLPFGVSWVFRDLDVGLLMILAVLGLEIHGVLLAGWASNNKWSVYGAIREACQVVSYEIPMGLTLLVPVMVVGSLRFNDIAAHQAGGWFNWLAWHSPWTFMATFIYFIASLASCKRAPFDLPEAESELVAGFHTEYSGFRWSLFFFAEYASMFVVSGVLVILFLGGWDAPWAGGRLAPAASGSLGRQFIDGIFLSGPIWFVLKCMFLVYVQMWLRWTLPRLRIDQVLYSCVQVILPLTLVVLLGCMFWELGLPRSRVFAGFAWGISVVLAIIGLCGAIGVLALAFAGFSRARQLVGTLAVSKPLAGG
ncbi:NADH-quinone oxidoreductase subunit H [Phycisphaerae bacterium RAS1]|nr:NADH-quinone oxidoreductase subunit H [Phycisphaerae bacterium RAS1]